MTQKKPRFNQQPTYYSYLLLFCVVQFLVYCSHKIPLEGWDIVFFVLICKRRASPIFLPPFKKKKRRGNFQNNQPKKGPSKERHKKSFNKKSSLLPFCVTICHIWQCSLTSCCFEMIVFNMILLRITVTRSSLFHRVSLCQSPKRS